MIQKSLLRVSLLAFFLCMFLMSQAQASLMVAPLRVVLDTKNRTTSILLLNTDNKTHTYQINWIMLKAQENGQYQQVPVDEKNPHVVPNMAVFSPRQVTIEPNGRQSIRVSFRPPADLPPGEYRGHLQFNTMPDPEDKTKKGAEGKKGQSLMVNVLMGVSVPVIIRTGGATGTVKLENSQLKILEDSKKPALAVTLAHQTGMNSAYGSIKIYAGEKELGLLNNIALFPEVAKRELVIPLTASPEAGSVLRVVYEGRGEYAGKTFAETDVTINK